MMFFGDIQKILSCLLKKEIPTLYKNLYLSFNYISKVCKYELHITKHLCHYHKHFYSSSSSSIVISAITCAEQENRCNCLWDIDMHLSLSVGAGTLSVPWHFSVIVSPYLRFVSVCDSQFIGIRNGIFSIASKLHHNLCKIVFVFCKHMEHVLILFKKNSRKNICGVQNKQLQEQNFSRTSNYVFLLCELECP